MSTLRKLGICLSVLFASTCDDDSPNADGGPDGGGDAGSDASDASDAQESPCPDDMAYITSFNVCIDRYEASEGSGGAAESVSGAQSWVRISREAASAACEAAGKRLCEANEWIVACQGEEGRIYPYGDTFEASWCNGAEAEAGNVVPTGQMGRCEGGLAGLFDMSGNVYEWTSPCVDGQCPIRGGDHNNPGADRHRCESLAQTADEPDGYGSIGFRCCLVPPAS